MKKIIFTLVCSVLLHKSYTQDTFSIVAVDENTGEVGSAGASCIAGSIIISDLHPNVGAIHTQSYWIQPNQDYASQLMQAGLNPSQIIDSLIVNDAQNDSTIRQYGVVDLNNGSPRSAAFTGSNCSNEKYHKIGDNYAIQGNILIDSSIIDAMEFRFLNTNGSLAERLMSALQGANIPGADSRCLNEGTSSKSSFIRVAKPTDANCYYLDINVNNTSFGVEPIDSLQILFDGLKNNCVGFKPELNLSRDTTDFRFFDGRIGISTNANIVACALWSFSDGVEKTGTSITHQFDEIGEYEVTLVASNYGCTDTITKQIVVVNDLLNPNAISNLKKESNYTIAPHPAKGFISIQLNHSHTVSKIDVYSTNGKLLYSKQITEKHAQNIIFDSKYRTGQFIVKIITPETVYTEKVSVL